MKSLRSNGSATAAHLREIREAPLKELLVGQHRDRMRARGLVLPRDRHRIEILRDDAGGRTGLLHLRDQPERLFALIHRRGERPEIIALKRRRAQEFLARKEPRDLRSFDIEDLLKPVGHGGRDNQTIGQSEVRQRGDGRQSDNRDNQMDGLVLQDLLAKTRTGRNGDAMSPRRARTHLIV
jgi:hypothetical protein